MTLIDKACFERGCACYDSRDKGECVEVVELESQEPVAWMSPNKERLEFSRKDTVYGSHTIPLYTHPQRTWVGLTDEEIDTWNIVGHESLREFVRAIEAKLKERNNA